MNHLSTQDGSRVSWCFLLRWLHFVIFHHSSSSRKCCGKCW